MVLTLEISSEPDLKWNERLLNSKMGTIFQTVENAEYQKIVGKFEHDFIKFLNPNGEIIGQLLLSERPRQGRLGKLKLTKLPLIPGNLYRWTYGPVIFNYDYANQIMITLKNYFKIKKRKAYGTIHPFSSKYFTELSELFKIQNWSTFLIDLSSDVECLWDHLDKHSARKNIERALKKNVTVKQITKSELLDYFNLLKHTKEKVGVCIDFLDTETTWLKLRKVGFDIFMAYYRDKPVGGLGISHFNSYVNEWGVGRSDVDFKDKLYAQDLIKWKIIEWSKKNNYSYFDLSGSNPLPVNSKEEGILRYKKKWGGKQVDLLIIRT